MVCFLMYPQVVNWQRLREILKDNTIFRIIFIIPFIFPNK